MEDFRGKGEGQTNRALSRLLVGISFLNKMSHPAPIVCVSVSIQLLLWSPNTPCYMALKQRFPKEREGKDVGIWHSLQLAQALLTAAPYYIIGLAEDCPSLPGFHEQFCSLPE